MPRDGLRLRQAAIPVLLPPDAGGKQKQSQARAERLVMFGMSNAGCDSHLHSLQLPELAELAQEPWLEDTHRRESQHLVGFRC